MSVKAYGIIIEKKGFDTGRNWLPVDMHVIVKSLTLAKAAELAEAYLWEQYEKPESCVTYRCRVVRFNADDTLLVIVRVTPWKFSKDCREITEMKVEVNKDGIGRSGRL